MKKNFSEVELINGPDYIVNRTPFVDKLSNDFDVVVQYIDQYKDLIDSLEHDFLNDDISYALYEESTEKGGGGDFVSHILQDPYIQSVVKFLINGVAEWFVSKAADNVYEKIKKLLVSSGSSKNYGIYFIAKIGLFSAF